MSDRFGEMTLPVTAGALAPKLDTLLAFARAVLVAQAQAAFAASAPAEPNEIVNRTYAENPRTCAFPENELPALFAYEDGGESEDLGDGFVRASGKIKLCWLFPPASKERKRAFDKISGPLARVLASALSDARHPSWTHADDEAQPDAIRLAAAAPLVATTYDGADLDGAIGDDFWSTPGRVLLTTTLGDWNTTDPIVVTMFRADGVERPEEIYLTSATGPETVEGAWLGSRVIDADVPAQPSADGTLAIGIALAPGAEFGSNVRERMGATYLRLAAWRRESIDVRKHNGETMRFDAVCFDVLCEETRTRDGAALDYPALDDATDGIGTTGEIVSLDGLTVEVQEA